MTECKIQIPEGYEIDKESSTFELIKFKQIENKFPTCWEDLDVICGYYIDEDSVVVEEESIRASKHNQNIIPTKQEAYGLLEAIKLRQIRDRVNNGWKPDWTDGRSKHCIEIYDNDICTVSYLSTQRPLTFKTEEIRDKFLENFKEQIWIARDWI